MNSPKRKPLVLGPGKFDLGDPGSPLDMSCQLTNLKISWDKDAEESVTTLCGGTLAGDRTYKAAVSGTVAQDVEKDGVVDYTWKNRGKEVAFTFTPVSSQEKVKVTGKLIIDPVELGGDVGKRGMSDFEWDVVGIPVFTPDDTQTGPLPGLGV